MKNTRFIVAVLAVLTLASAPAFAEDKSNGCGLGWQITKKTSFSATTTRSTTNAFVPPTFGMTSGTLGCAPHSLVKADQDAAVYATANLENLKLEMAEGQGEGLQAFAQLMGCSESAYGDFARTMQAGYSRVSRGNGVEVMQNVKNELKQSPALASACRS